MIIMPTNKYLNKNVLSKLVIDYLAKQTYRLTASKFCIANYGDYGVCI